MLIYHVEAYSPFVSKAEINHHLGEVDDLLARDNGGVFCAERTATPSRLNILLRVADERALNDALEAACFIVRRADHLGTPDDTYVEFGGWQTPQASARRQLENYLLDPRLCSPGLSPLG